MNNLYAFALLAALALGTMHYRRQGRGDTGLPPGHPRRRRAQLLFPFMVSFAVLAVFAWGAGTDGTPGLIALAGFAVWFVALFAVNKQIPREAAIRAYEAAHPTARFAAPPVRAAQAPPRPAPPLRMFDTEALSDAAAARAAASEAAKAVEAARAPLTVKASGR